jgi:GTP pyrophosphokinase
VRGCTLIRFGDIVERIEAYNPDYDEELIQKAYIFTAKAHQGQIRLSGEPYLIHPLEVAGILADMQLDEQTIATGLLHDTIEDTYATYDQLKELFGKEVADLVEGVTKISKMSFESSEDTQAENFRKMILAMTKDIRAILVKLADRLHNMRTLEFQKAESRQRIAQETIEIYAPIANRLGIEWMKSELEDLSFKYIMTEAYQALEKKIAKSEKERNRYIEYVKRILQEKLMENGIAAQISGRPKHLYSIFKKMQSQNIEFNDIYDITAFRVIVSNVTECYEVLGIIHNLWTPIPGKFKDYIALPKANLYQSLHTTVIGPKGERIEIQIRTHEMHQVAEMGIAAHWKYKEGINIDEKDDKRFRWLRQLFEYQKDLQNNAEFLETIKIDLFPDEVFVFTPTGEVKEFPRGSTPIDFAYSIHTEVGNHCKGAKVNGKIVPLKYVLHNGDSLEIITHPHAHPSKDWLKIVKTSRARTKIRQWIKTQEREQSIQLGRELLEKETKRYSVNFSKLYKNGSLKEVAEAFSLQTVDDLLATIGYGKITPRQVIRRILPPEKLEDEEEKPFKRIFSKIKRKDQSPILIRGVDNVMVKLAKCCNPLPGDKIVGFITRGRGITIHKADCEKILDSDPQRLIEAKWKVDDTVRHPVRIQTASTDRRGLLAEITKELSAQGADILSAHVQTTQDHHAINQFVISIKDLKHLNKIIRALSHIKGITEVKRLHT